MVTKNTLPSNKDIEQGILGAMLNDNKCLDEVMMLITTPEAFYFEESKLLFTAMQSLYKKNSAIDILTVGSELRAMNKLADVGGDMFLINLSVKVSSSAHVEYHIRLLQQMFLRRMVILFNSKITASAYDDSVDIFDLIKRWSSEFDKVNDVVLTGRKTVTFQESLNEVMEHVQFLSSKKPGDITGMRTGFERINKFTNGYQPGHVIILAARPGMGKTSKVLKTALENVRHGVPVGMVSLEMPMMELTSRVIALDSNFHLSQLIKDGFDKDEYFVTLSDHLYRMKDYPFFIDDSAKSDIVDVVTQARVWKREHGIKLLIVDYLQLMGDRTRGNNRESEISAISRRLKLLAKELELPIIVLSQLSREVEKRPDKRPKLSDLRESGAIEQDADVVEFIYRPGYYKIEVDDEYMIEEGTDTEIIFAKNRHGSVGTTSLKWIGDKTKFVDPTDPNERKYFENVSYNEVPY